MNYQLNFKLYQRPFKHPLKTRYGVWEIREGIIISLTNDPRKIGQGEIAPIPWFGSENLAESRAFCQAFNGIITEQDIINIPDHLPACQFGFESALNQVKFNQKNNLKTWQYSYLLNPGDEIKTINQLYNQENARTFKLKIGIKSCQEEINYFQQLISQIPEDVKLRLDANGGLSLTETETWLKVIDKINNIEFLEQPLSPEYFDLMLKLSQNHPTPIALDESVANLQQLEQCYHQGWRGIYIIKAAIMGSPDRLRQFCKNHPLDAVFSSVFETKIGRESVLQLADELSNPNRALGFGVDHRF